MSVAVGKSKTCRMGPQGWRPRGEVMYSSRPKRPSSGRIPSYSEEVSLFVLFRLLTGCTRPTQMIEGLLLYSKSTEVNVSLIQNTSIETPRIILNQIPGHHGPAKLTHRINHLKSIVQISLNHTQSPSKGNEKVILLPDKMQLSYNNPKSTLIPFQDRMKRPWVTFILPFDISQLKYHEVKVTILNFYDSHIAYVLR